MRGYSVLIGIVVVTTIAALLLGNVGTNPAMAAVGPSVRLPPEMHPGELAASSSTAFSAVATQVHSAVLNWNQTGTGGLFAGHGTSFNTTFNLAVNASGAVVSSNEQVTQSSGSSDMARLNIRQGTTVLANTTENSFTVHPTISNTPVNVSLVTVETSGGGTVAKGDQYRDNVTEVSTLDLSRNVAFQWTYSAPTYTAVLYDNSSNGYWVNASVFTVPLPSVPINGSSVAVTMTGTGASLPVVTSASGSFSVITIARINPDSTVKLTITARAQLSTSVYPVPYVRLPKPVRGTRGSWESSATYHDTTIAAYDGVFIIYFPNGTVPNTANLTVKVNGTVLKATAQYTVVPASLSNGATITLLPGALMMYTNQTATVSVTWYSISGIPAISVAGYGYGILPGVTLGSAIGGVALAFFGFAAVLSGAETRWRWRWFRWQNLSTDAKALWLVGSIAAIAWISLYIAAVR